MGIGNQCLMGNWTGKQEKRSKGRSHQVFFSDSEVNLTFIIFIPYMFFFPCVL